MNTNWNIFDELPGVTAIWEPETFGRRKQPAGAPVMDAVRSAAIVLGTRCVCFLGEVRKQAVAVMAEKPAIARLPEPVKAARVVRADRGRRLTRREEYHQAHA